MRTVFMGAAPFAVPALEALVALGAEVVAVYTKAPKPAGRRGLALTKTAVHLKAEELGLPVLTPLSLRNEAAQAEFAALRADIAVVAAYGLILPRPILASPRLGCVNLHGSLLPRWRGAAPIQRAIMASDAETGVGLMGMEEGLDTGPVAKEARTPIGAAETAGDLTIRLSRLAADLVRDNFDDLTQGRLVFRPQPAEGVTYAAKIDKAETAIDWTQDAATVRGQINGLSPAPGAYAEVEIDGRRERIKFLRVEAVEARGPAGTLLDRDFVVACGSGAIRALEAQRAGKSPMKGADLLRGGTPAIGARFLSRGELANR